MNRMSLSARMTIAICTAVVLILSALIYLQVRQAEANARQEAFGKVEEMAFRYRNEVGQQLNDALIAARTVGQTFEGMKAGWVDDRSLYNSILKQVILANPNLVAVWSCWEPDQLDGKDKDFVNKSGHDSTGRFIPLWYRAKDDAQLEKLVDYDTPGKGNYYLEAKTSGRETPIEPQTFKTGIFEHGVTGITVPMRFNGQLLGAVGVLVPLESIDHTVAAIHPYDKGFATLISAGGIYVSNTDASKIGKSAWDDPALQPARDAVRAGKIFTQLSYSAEQKRELYEITVPISVGSSEARWALSVSVPMYRVLEGTRRMMWNSMFLGICGIGAIVLMVLWLARSISRPLRSVSESLSRVAAAVDGAAFQLRDAGQSLSGVASEQAASLEETSTSLEEISSMTRSNSDNANKVNILAKEARAAADLGAADMQSMSQAMSEIRSSSNDITKIVKTIDEIAFQTNILALNAAVEAARAGDAGMGFAVVAEEVRSLAQRSAQAARETAEKIEGALRKTEQGVEITGKIAQTLEVIVGKARQVDQFGAEVATASKEQSLGIERLNSTVGRMDSVTRRNVASADQAAAAASELGDHARLLSDSVRELNLVVHGRARAPSAAANPPENLPPSRRGLHNSPKPGVGVEGDKDYSESTHTTV